MQHFGNLLINSTYKFQLNDRRKSVPKYECKISQHKIKYNFKSHNKDANGFYSRIVSNNATAFFNPNMITPATYLISTEMLFPSVI